MLVRNETSGGAHFRAAALLTPAAALVLGLAAAPTAVAKPLQYEVLHSFKGGKDGATPWANLIADKAGNLYGTTGNGGANDEGTVFKITAAGVETVLYSFSAAQADCHHPGNGNLVLDSGGSLYGSCLNGGVANYGVIFKLAPDGTETVLHSFLNGDDGSFPDANLILDNEGNLYSTAGYGGGVGLGYGVVFKMAPDGTETVLHAFAGYSGGDGAYPNGLIRDREGNLYGQTQNGGTYNQGTVFKLTAGKKGKFTESVLYSFTGGPDGGSPMSNLTPDSVGNLYGSTPYGGANGFGTVFKLAPDGSFNLIYTFDGTGPGGNPQSTLSRNAAGTLFGTSNWSAGCCGSIFQITSAGKGTALHNFTNSPDGNVVFGNGTMASVGDYLYGTAENGGANNFGIVFKVRK